MKKLLLIFLFIPILSYSQDTKTIEYITVYSISETHEVEEGKYDNVALFRFYEDGFSGKDKCYISFRLVDSQGNYIQPDFDHNIGVLTGWNYEYKEDEGKVLSNGLVALKISTTNLPRFIIGIGYYGEILGLRLQDVTIEFVKEKLGSE